MNWDQYFYNICLVVLEKSKDQSTKVGCVIADQKHGILTTGYNDFPRGVFDNSCKVLALTAAGLNIKDVEARRQRPQKYMWTEHAERNAIYNAARSGIRLEGGILYCVSKPKEFPPCSDCTRAIIQSGIIEVVFNYDDIPEQWKESCEVSFKMYQEAGIKVRKFSL